MEMTNLPNPEIPREEYYFYPHLHKEEYDRAFNLARRWALDNPNELPTAAARIYYVKVLAFRKSVRRAKDGSDQKRDSQGRLPQHGGHNKIMDESMEEAIRQYCVQQW
jgi:hypothetical protein